MNVRYRVTLDAERARSSSRLWSQAARRRARSEARADSSRSRRGPQRRGIATTVPVGTSTVYRTKQRFVEEGLERALSEMPRPGGKRKLVDERGGDARRARVLDAAHGSCALDAGAAGRRDGAADDARARSRRETIRRRLDENELKPWQQKMWCIPKVDAEFVARMEDVLELYADRRRRQARPVVCFDETPRQLIGEARVPVRAEPGQSRALRLRVRAQRHRERLHVRRRAPAVAARQGDRPSRLRRLRRVHARPRRRALSRGRAHPRRPRQPLDALRRRRSTSASRPTRRAASCAASSSTSRRSTRAGSTWSRSRSA